MIINFNFLDKNNKTPNDPSLKNPISTLYQLNADFPFGSSFSSVFTTSLWW